MHTNGFLAITLGLIILNQVAARSNRFRSSKPLFWGLQAINIGCAFYLFLYGVPGLAGPYAGFGSFILGLLFLFRGAQNMIIVLETEREAKTQTMLRQREVSMYELQQMAAQQAAEEAAAEAARAAASTDGAPTDPIGDTKDPRGAPPSA